MIEKGRVVVFHIFFVENYEFLQTFTSALLKFTKIYDKTGRGSFFAENYDCLQISMSNHNFRRKFTKIYS